MSDIDASGSILTDLTLTCDGKLFLRGNFPAVDGINRPQLARLDATTGRLDQAFDPPAEVSGQPFTVYPDGRVLVGNSIRLYSDGGIDDTLDAESIRSLTEFVALPDGKLIGYNPETGELRKFLGTGESDPAFPADLVIPRPNAFSNAVKGLSVLPTGHMFVGGQKLLTLNGATIDFDLAGYRPQTQDVLDFLAPANGRLWMHWSDTFSDRFTAHHLIEETSSGEIGFVYDHFLASEEAGLACVSVRRLGELSKALTVRFEVVPDTAVNGTHFEGTAGELVFEAGKRSVELRIPLIDDSDWDGDRKFRIELTPTANSSIDQTHSSTIVTIADNDGAGSFSLFEGFEWALTEGGHESLKVVRSGSYDGNVTVDYEITPITADRHDFESLTGTIIFADGQKEAELPPLVVDDAVVESTETATIQLVRVSAGELGGKPSRLFGVDDNDRPGSGWFSYFHAPSSAEAILALPGGRVLFVGANNHSMVIFDSSGAQDQVFESKPNDLVYSLALDPAGRIFAAGKFTKVGEKQINYLVRYLPGGDVDTTFENGSDKGPNARIFRIVTYPDGRVLIAGRFSTYSGKVAAGIARLMPDGSLDPSFDSQSLLSGIAGEPSPAIDGLELCADGRILVSGQFNVNGLSPYLIRLLPDGAIDRAFVVPTATINGAISAMLPLRNGSVMVGGNFQSNAGPSYFGKLLPDGTIDRTFELAGLRVINPVTAIRQLEDGKLLIAGSLRFDETGGQQQGTAILYPDGALYQSLVSNYPSPISEPRDGLIYVSFGPIGPFPSRISASPPENALFDNTDTWARYYFSPAERSGVPEEFWSKDDDGDGVSNFAEYAGGTNPRILDHSVGGRVARLQDGIVEITFPGNYAARDVVHTPQSSVDARNWEDLVAPQVSDLTALVVRVDSDPNGTGVRIFRLSSALQANALP
ncbi:MAG: hypothetical protein KDN22_23135 [Verrucomicrobiae bacterium]|nr:hypothetical protein [Verrucomicrobiae bacterium]